MSDANAARRYARALLELALDAKAEDTVLADLQGFHEAVTSESGELFSALSSPVFTDEERKGVLSAVLEKVKVHDLTRNILSLLAERGRMNLLPSIVEHLAQSLDERAGRLRVRVSTVDPLTPQLEEELVAAFSKATGKQVVLDATIDTSLIGGLVARVGDRVYDASIKTRLEDIKHRLIYAQATPEA